MDVAITGSTGLIGSALVADLEADGHRVARLVRPSSSAVDGETITWDPSAGTIDAAALEGIDALVHLAGEGIESRRWTAEQKTRILESRTRSTDMLATTIDALRQPPSVWVSGSAIGYYGDRGDDVLDEAEPPATDFLADVCRQWEAAARTDADTRIAHVRTGIVLAAHGGALRPLLPFFRLGLGGRNGDGSQYWSWISLTDEIAAIRHIIDSDLEGPVNLTAPEPVTNAEFAKALGRALGRPTVLPTPRVALDLRLGRELAEALVYTSARVQPRALLDSGFVFAHTTIDAALRDALEK